MKNLKKIIATILTITLAISCIGSVNTFGSDISDDDYFSDGTATYYPGLFASLKASSQPTQLSRRQQRLIDLKDQGKKFNIVNVLSDPNTEGKEMVFRLFFISYINEKCRYPLVLPAFYLKNSQVIEQAVTNIIEKIEEKFGLNFSSLFDGIPYNNQTSVAFLKIIYDFMKSDLPDEDKKEITKGCDLFNDGDIINSIMGFIEDNQLN